jgi:hypothetical protein
MKRTSSQCVAVCVLVAGCAAATPAMKADLNAAFSVAAASEAAYAAQPGANATTVAEMAQLLAAAQAALLSWSNSTNPADQTAAGAAIAALVAFEASATQTP